MDKISQSKNELENIKILLERKSKEVEIIKQISNQINKSLNLNLIASSMLSLMNEFLDLTFYDSTSLKIRNISKC